jgi:hypothetical protein
MLLCTVLTFAMCADPRVDGVITVGDLAVPIVWSHATVRSCMDLGAQATQDGAGLTRLETGWQSSQTRELSDGFAGHLVVRVLEARIELTAYSWNRMTPAGAEALRGIYRATLWHEIGHVRTLLATIDALNAEPEFGAPTAAAYTELAKKHGSAASVRVNADQTAYDRAAEHGLRQDTLPLPLAGPNTVVNCPSGGR